MFRVYRRGSDWFCLEIREHCTRRWRGSCRSRSIQVEERKGCKEHGEEGNLGNSRLMNRISEVPKQLVWLSSSALSLECRGSEWPGATEMSLERWFRVKLGRVLDATLIWTLSYTRWFLTFFGERDESYKSSCQKLNNDTHTPKMLHTVSWVLTAHLKSITWCHQL